MVQGVHKKGSNNTIYIIEQGRRFWTLPMLCLQQLRSPLFIGECGLPIIYNILIRHFLCKIPYLFKKLGQPFIPK